MLITVFFPLAKTFAVQAEQSITQSWALCNVSKPFRKAHYLVGHKTVEWEHGPYVWGLQLTQVTQDGHVTQNAAVHSPGKRATTREGQVARRHAVIQTGYLEHAMQD